MSSAVEDVASAIAESVRKNGWRVVAERSSLYILANKETDHGFCRLFCQDDSQAKRLAAMLGAA